MAKYKERRKQRKKEYDKETANKLLESILSDRNFKMSNTNFKNLIDNIK